MTCSRRFSSSVALALAMAAVAIHYPRAAQDAPRKRIIVELAAPAPVVVEADRAVREGRTFDQAAHERAVSAAQDQFLAALGASGVGYTVTTTPLQLANGPHLQTNRFSYLINAVGIELPADAADAIASMTNVRHVTDDESLRPLLDHSVRYIGASAGPGNKTIFTQGGGPLTRYDGAGQVIAVLDTGIEHTHPAFDTRFPDSEFTSRTGDLRPVRLAGQPYVQGVNHAKIVYSLTLTAATQEDDAGHGTHAAADAAGMKVRAPGPDKIPGTADDRVVEGVAPGALLMAYKVCETSFTCVGTVAGLVIALEDAVRTSDPLGFPKPVATVLNMSFGGGGNPNDASAVAASNAALAGAVAVASAGNGGRAGENTVGAPSAGRRVISVAATNDPGTAPNEVDVLVTDAARYTNALGSTGAQNDAGRPKAAQDRLIIANLTDGSPSVSVPGLGFPLGQHYVYVGLADTPDQVPDAVKGRIALAVRGSTVDASASGTGLFAHKAAEVAAKGGLALLVMNNVAGELTGVTSIFATIPVFGISKENGEYLRDVLGFGGGFNKDDRTTWGVISNFPIRINPVDPAAFSPSTTVFSSRGPVDNFQFLKPDITAPGQSVFAATIVAGGFQVSTATTPPGVAPLPMADVTRYVSASGTSFSGPQVAGAAALVRQAMLAARGHAPIPLADLRNGGGAAMQRFQNSVAPQSLVRAALTNTATNLREADGETAVADTDRRSFIHEIGAGLVHVRLAVDARAALGTNTMNGGGGPDDAEDPNFLPTHSFGARRVIDTGNPAQTVSVAVTLQNVTGAAGAGTYSLSLVDGGALRGTVTRPIVGTPGFSVSLGASSVTLDGAVNARVSFPVTVTVDGRPAPDGLALAGKDSTGAEATEFLWWVVARGSNGAVLRMPFYYRAVKSAVAGGSIPSTAATLGAVQDDADPDWINGVDQDGRYRLSWTYENNPNLEQPCAFQIEEASSFTALFADNAEAPMVAGNGNPTWSGAVQWHSRSHPTTGTLGYSVLYTDNLNSSLTIRSPLPVPAGGRTVMTFDSWEDIEPGFDFARVEAAGADGVFQALATYSGLATGERAVDLSAFGGQSVRVRFRFTTDLLISTPFHGGWFIDNVKLQNANFAVLATVPGTARSYDVQGRFDGTYSYRVVPLFGESCDQPGASSNVRQITVGGRGQAADPVSDFSASPNPAQATQPVTFDGSASRDGDENGCCIQQYFWAFGDGATATSSGPEVTHAYEAPGAYRVVLTVTDNEGKSASSEQFVQVTYPPRAGESEGGGWIAVASDRGHFTFDVQTDSATAAGTMSYTDRGSQTRVEAVSISSVTFNGATARITGTCTVNKAAGFTFTIDVGDAGDPGKGRDTFAIALSNGYRASGTLGGGNIAVR